MVVVVMLSKVLAGELEKSGQVQNFLEINQWDHLPMGLDIKTKEKKQVRMAGWNEYVEGLVGRKVSRGWGND